MHAIVSTQYGSPDVMQCQTVDRPTPKDDEVLVKIYAAGVNAADWRWLRGDPVMGRLMYGLLKPKNTILGADIAGRVEAVGGKVTVFKPGDAVFGDLSAGGFGGFAEYVCARADALALKPANLSFEQAAAVPIGATTALRLLRKGQIQRGQKVVIYGASGSVGTYALQLAKYFGADVTAVCSTASLEVVRALGADRVSDYTREDFSAGAERYDVIFDAVGKLPPAKAARALTPHGVFVTIAKLDTKEKLENLTFIREVIEAGQVKAVIDRCYPLEQMVAAHRYVEAGHKRGNVVITVQ